MIDLIISATVGAIAGFGICAVMTVGRIDDLAGDLFHTECELEAESAVTETLVPKLRDANASNARLSDALATKQSRIDRALSCETPKAAHGVKKMARLLRGEEA